MDIEINGQLYRTGRLDARRQLHVARRLANLPISVLIGSVTDGSEVPQAVRERAEASGFSMEEMQNALPALMPTLSLRSLGELTEVDCDYVVNSCLSVCQRKSGSNGVNAWAPVWNAGAGRLMFDDMDLQSMLQLTVHVLRENLGSFFGGSPLSSPGPLQTAPVSTG